jgi:hypothetical protein
MLPENQSPPEEEKHSEPEDLPHKTRQAIEKSNKADITILARYPRGYSALFFHALRLGKTDILAMLKEMKSDADYKIFLMTPSPDEDNKTPVMRAAQCGFLKGLEWMYHSESILNRLFNNFSKFLQELGLEGKEAFLLAFQNGQLEILEWMNKNDNAFESYTSILSQENLATTSEALFNWFLSYAKGKNNLHCLIHAEEVFLSVHSVHEKFYFEVSFLPDIKGSSLAKHLVKHNRMDLIPSFLQAVNNTATLYCLMLAILEDKRDIAQKIAKDYFPTAEAKPFLNPLCMQADYLISYLPSPMGHIWRGKNELENAQALLLGFVSLSELIPLNGSPPVWGHPTALPTQLSNLTQASDFDSASSHRLDVLHEEKSLAPEHAFAVKPREARLIETLLYAACCRESSDDKGDNSLNFYSLMKYCTEQMKNIGNQDLTPWSTTGFRYFQAYFELISRETLPTITYLLSSNFNQVVVFGDASMREWIFQNSSSYYSYRWINTAISDNRGESGVHVVERYGSLLSFDDLKKSLEHSVKNVQKEIAKSLLTALIEQLVAAPPPSLHEEFRVILEPLYLQQHLVTKCTALIEEAQNTDIIASFQKDFHTSSLLFRHINSPSFAQLFFCAAHFCERTHDFLKAEIWYSAINNHFPKQSEEAYYRIANLYFDGHVQHRELLPNGDPGDGLPPVEELRSAKRKKL